MRNRRSTIHGLRRRAGIAVLLSLPLAAGPALAQQAAARDPAEPPPGTPDQAPALLAKLHAVAARGLRPPGAGLRGGGSVCGWN